MATIAILDYGMGNLRSVEKALERAGATPLRTRDHDEIRAADGAVLPGVGAFPKAMRAILGARDSLVVLPTGAIEAIVRRTQRSLSDDRAPKKAYQD